MSTRLRIKYGSVELDYEGDLALEKADVFGLLETLSTLTPPQANAPGSGMANQTDSGAGLGKAPAGIESVSDIAQRLDVKTGPDLAVAACAALHFIESKSYFESKEISSTMRQAHHFFQESYAANLSATLARLVKKGTLRSVGGGRYALSNGDIEDLKKRLA